MDLYFIRHARQNSSLCNVDVELSKEGICQAELLAKRLQTYSFQKIYSSDLLRAVQTAKLINTKHLEHKIYSELREIDFGDLTGNTDQENQRCFGDFLRKRKELTEDLAFPGGECGEDVVQRVMPVLEEITAQKIEGAVIVTHGGTIRCLVAELLGMSQAKKLLLGVTLENSSITHLSYDKQRRLYTLERFNDAAHLEGYKNLQRNSWVRT